MTEFGLIEPSQQRHFSTTWRRLRVLMERLVGQTFASWNQVALWLRQLDNLRSAA